MRIAYLATSKIPSRDADSIHVMKMAYELASSGNEVTLYTHDSSQTEHNIDDIYEYYGVENNFSIIKTSLKVPSFKRMRHFRHACAAVRYLRKAGYDCIYGRDVMACALIAFLHRKPVIIECHASMKQNPFEYLMLRALLKSKYLKKTVVITEWLKKYFVTEYKAIENLIYVAPDGADNVPEDVMPETLVPQSEGKFNIGYIGQLYKGRGMDVISKLAVSCPFAFFHIIGGEDRDIEHWKKEIGQTENIHFYGFVPPSQTVGFGKSMDVLLAPYKDTVATSAGNAVNAKKKYNQQNWMSPLKIFEYMALGKPIVTTRLPGIEEVLCDGKNALLCPPNDIMAWSGAIRRLYEDREFASLLARNALTDFEKYTWAARAGNLLRDVILTA